MTEPAVPRPAGPVRGLAIDFLADHPEAAGTVARWLHREWFAAWGGTLAQSERSVRQRMQRDRLPLCLVAHVAGRPVGTASLVEDRRPDTDATVCALAGLFVVPGCRGRGMGSLLCERAVAEAVRLRQRELAVFTPGQERFYARRGWRKLAVAGVHGGAGLVQVAYLARALPGSRGASA